MCSPLGFVRDWRWFVERWTISPVEIRFSRLDFGNKTTPVLKLYIFLVYIMRHPSACMAWGGESPLESVFCFKEIPPWEKHWRVERCKALVVGSWGVRLSSMLPPLSTVFLW